MKILVLEQDIKERSLIEQALQVGVHELVVVETAEQCWELMNKGDVRFVIADAESSNVIEADLVRRVRSAGIPHIYFLILTSHKALLPEADDILHKPFKALELRSRLAIGQRILVLGDSLSQAREQLESMAMYDPLTGLMNYAAFCRLAQGEVERARRSLLPFSLIAFKIDNFKALCEQHGLEMSDNIIRSVSRNIREKSRPYDSVGRWAEAEFVVSLPGIAGADAKKIAERIVMDIRSAGVSIENTVVSVRMSGGVVTAAPVGPDLDVNSLVEQARQAASLAKESGEYQTYLPGSGTG